MDSAVRRDADLADFRVGDWVHFGRRYSRDDFEAFARLSGDRNPLHWDSDYARRTAFARPIVPFHLAAAPISAIAGMMMPGHRSLYLGSNLRALKPVPYDTEIEYSARVAAVSESQRVLTLRVLAFSASEVLLAGEVRVRVRDDVGPEAAPPSPVDVRVHRAGEERLATVTGASGAIGRAVARRLAARGWNLLLHCHRNKATVAELARECRAAGVQAKPVQADLTDAGAVKRLAKHCRSATALVHTASAPLDAPLDTLMAVNFGSLRALTEAMTPAVLRRQDGFVALIGSAALQTFPEGWSDYIAAKAAAVSHVASLRRHLGPYGLNALTVAPGFVATGFSEGYREPGDPALLPEEVADCIVDASGGRGADAPEYVHLDVSGRSHGRFGFVGVEGKREAAERPAAAPQADASEGADRRTNACGARVDALVRAFLDLPSTADLEQAGLDITPNWDSLRHIELMLALEEEFGIALSSGDFERTVRHPDLRELIVARAGRPGAN